MPNAVPDYSEQLLIARKALATAEAAALLRDWKLAGEAASRAAQAAEQVELWCYRKSRE